MRRKKCCNQATFFCMHYVIIKPELQRLTDLQLRLIMPVNLQRVMYTHGLTGLVLENKERGSAKRPKIERKVANNRAKMLRLLSVGVIRGCVV